VWRYLVTDQLKEESVVWLPSSINKPVWQREYWDRYIRNECHYTQTVDYIHNNPVEAGLVECAEAWPWSNVSKSNGDAGHKI
jgi:REP element-mobilizing transposase RayT